MDVRTLFWDFDQTLACRDGMWSPTVHDLLLRRGITRITVEELHVRFSLPDSFPWHRPELSHAAFFEGVPWWDAMTRRFTRTLLYLGVPEPDASAVARGVRTEYLNPAKWRLYDDTLPCLKRAASEGYRNAIVSNHVPELGELVQTLGIGGYFEKVYSSADVGWEKPNPRIFQAALAGMGVSAGVVMIGDSLAADVRGALAAGLCAVLARGENTTGYPYSCRTLEGLFEVLDRIKAE